MWSLYLAIGAGSIPVLFLINDDENQDPEAQKQLEMLMDLDFNDL